MKDKTYNIAIIVVIVLILIVAMIFLFTNLKKEESASVKFDVTVPELLFVGDSGAVNITAATNVDVSVSYKYGYLTSTKNTYSGTEIKVPFRALKVGYEIVEVSSNKTSKKMIVQVCDNLNLKNQTITLDVNRTKNLNFNITPKCLEAYTFKMENEAIASYENGQIKAKKTGTTKLLITRGNEKYTYNIKVNQSVTSLVFANDRYSIYAGDVVENEVTILPKNAVDKTISCLTSNKNVATVKTDDDRCIITGVKGGNATITVKANSGVAATCKVTVEDVVRITSIGLNKTSATLAYGDNTTLTKKIEPANATEKVTWSSSNTKVAKVDQNGKITTTGTGTATIIVKTASGKKAECNLKVDPYIKEDTYPYIYRDGTAEITIEKKENMGILTGKKTVYHLIHVVLKDYSRLHVSPTASGRDSNGKYKTQAISKAATNVGAILALEADYSTNGKVGAVRNGVYYNYLDQDPSTFKTTKVCYAYYNNKTGVLGNCKDLKSATIADAISSKELTDTFRFGGNLLINGQNNLEKDPTKHTRQSNFVGYVSPGEFYFVVAEGAAYTDSTRPSDGISKGLTQWEKAELLRSLGCKFGTQLDGGKSIIVWFRGKKLQAKGVESERTWLTDFIYFK